MPQNDNDIWVGRDALERALIASFMALEEYQDYDMFHLAKRLSSIYGMTEKQSRGVARAAMKRLEDGSFDTTGW